MFLFHAHHLYWEMLHTIIRGDYLVPVQFLVAGQKLRNSLPNSFRSISFLL